MPEIAEPVDARPREKVQTRRQPRYNVILWDDDDHSYLYVARMLNELFGYPMAKGWAIARSVDTQGKAICLTTTREHAELKQDQIHAYRPAVVSEFCIGSMYATIEPVDSC